MNPLFNFLHPKYPECIRAFYGVFWKCPVWQTGHFAGFSRDQSLLFMTPRITWMRRNLVIIQGWEGRDWYERCRILSLAPGRLVFFYFSEYPKKNIFPFKKIHREFF
jgi:hypothetical protein